MGDRFPVPRRRSKQNSDIDAIVVDGDEEAPVTLRDSGIQWRFNIAKLPELLKEGDMQCWKFHNVPFFSAHANRVTASLIEAAKGGKTLYDPN